MIRQLDIATFLAESVGELILDVRTPAEFEQGHIIGAENLPLFTNDERVLVGTCYKQKGRQPAILLGFELIGDRWAHYIRTVEEKCKARSSQVSNRIFVHCWRGGMRSGAMAWALSLYGFEVCLLKGGYKTYRNDCLETLQQNYPILILGGKTGCAKTPILLEMKKQGEQVIDLEGLAQHQGSSFGSKGYLQQPTQEMFENSLAHELKQQDPSKPIWLENESRGIGKRIIPPAIFAQMRDAKVIQIEMPYEDRLAFLYNDYGLLDRDFLKLSIEKIAKRYGPNETKLTLQAIDEGRIHDFIRMVLKYYDKTYEKSQDKRLPGTTYPLSFTAMNPAINAKEIIEFSHTIDLLTTQKTQNHLS